MPIVKTTIAGSEYDFAPLDFDSFESLWNLRDAAGADPFKFVRLAWPLLQKSAGGKLPELSTFPADQTWDAVRKMSASVYEACGMALPKPGEESPVQANL